MVIVGAGALVGVIVCLRAQRHEATWGVVRNQQSQGFSAATLSPVLLRAFKELNFQHLA
jgi:hypothetical protein